MSFGAIRLAIHPCGKPQGNLAEAKKKEISMDPGRYVALKTKGLITLEKGPLPGQIAFTATQFDITGEAIDPDRGIFEKESLLALRKELSDKIAAIDQMIIDTDKTLSP